MMEKKIYLGTNTKMYKTVRDTVDYITELQERTQDIDRAKMQLFVIPSFTALQDANQVKKPELLMVGAQNAGWEEQGQFTGEISSVMLSELGTDLVMIGHSERRHILRETDEEENKKVLCALEHEFTVLLCVGETGEEKEYGISEETIRIQLKRDLYRVRRERLNRLWIAYEPVWAIGVNGRPASKEYAEKIHKVIRDTLIELFGKDAAQMVPILYGGSVNQENAFALSRMEHIDGLFVGRAAWQAENFEKIIRSVLR